MNILDMLKTRNEIAEKRLAICNECEHYNKKVTQCKKCGCFMIAKTRVLSAECPIKKWEAEKELNT